MFQQLKELLLDTKANMAMVTVILGVLFIISTSVGFSMFICERNRRLGEQSPRLNLAYIGET